MKINFKNFKIFLDNLELSKQVIRYLALLFDLEKLQQETKDNFQIRRMTKSIVIFIMPFLIEEIVQNGIFFLF